MRTNFAILRRAIRAYPGSRDNQTKWLAAVAILRGTKGGWILDKRVASVVPIKRRARG